MSEVQGGCGTGIWWPQSLRGNQWGLGRWPKFRQLSVHSLQPGGVTASKSQTAVANQQPQIAHLLEMYLKGRGDEPQLARGGLLVSKQHTGPPLRSAVSARQMHNFERCLGKATLSPCKTRCCSWVLTTTISCLHK